MFTSTVKRYTALVKENRAIAIVCVGTAISMTGQGIVSPVLPLLARGFGVGATAIGLAVGVFGLARLLINLPAGLVGQRFGRKLLMGGGLLFSAIGVIFTGTSHSIAEMVGWRFLAGAGSAMYVTGAMSFIADISTPENRGRLMSLQQGSLLLGVDIGPTIGGFVADLLGFRWPFYLAGILAGAAALWIFVRLPETRAVTKEPASLRLLASPGNWKRGLDTHTIGRLLANPTFLLVSIFTLVVFFTRTGSRQSLLPLLAVDRLGMSVTQLGLLFTVMTTITFLFVLPAGALSDRFGRKALILPGTLLSLIGLSLFAWASSLWAFFGAAVVLGCGTGIIGPAPAAYAGDLAPPGKTGVTMGLYRTFGDLGFVVGPVLLGWIADAFQGRFASISGIGVAMEFNALLLGGIALLLVVAARETAGKRRSRSDLVRAQSEDG